MINPEHGTDAKSLDYADPLVWMALGLEDGNFESEVDKAFSSNRIGTLARVAARLNFINDHDARHIDAMAEDYLVIADKRDIIADRVNMLPDAERAIYFAILQDEHQHLNREMDKADFGS